MLQRDRQIRTQIQQLADACLFGFSFWMAFMLRVNPQIIAWLGLDSIPSDIFNRIVWLYLLLIVAAPLLLESQGFYNHAVLCSRRDILWPLFKGCFITTVGLVLVMYALHFVSPRVVMAFFFCISFTLVYLKEELVRWVLHSKFAQFQYKRRFILIATGSEIARLRDELNKKADPSVEIVGELRLGEAPLQHLAQMLHEHSANGVIISARHTYFEQVENAIKTCELEGIEAWLVADFFWNANLPRALRRIARPSPAGLSHHAGNLLAGRRQATHGFLRVAGVAGVVDGDSGDSPHRAGDQAHLARPGFIPPATRRPQRLALHALQIPHHGDQRRTIQTRTGGHE
jgi:hypothetical protein